VARLELVKYEALGNDFLVLVDWRRKRRFDDELATSLCDRHRGVGADGLIRISAGDHGGALRMDLYNGDGSSAPTSGNGLRCAVLCARDAGRVVADRLVVETAAGDVEASLEPADGEIPARVRVGMGIVRVEPLATSPLRDWRAYRVDVGNRHLVLIGGAPGDVDLAAVGPPLERGVPGGQNVEFVGCREGSDELDLVVWERGVGLTLACGSGSVAAAVAAHLAGFVGRVVVVHNPGGDLAVELASTASGVAATLIGPARRVARIVVDVETSSSEKARVA
jgi:diaminopimelate epimerase